MPRVLFTADHDYRHPKFPQTIAYKAGHKLLVSQHCADEVTRLGKAALVAVKSTAVPPTAEVTDAGTGRRG